MQPTQSAYITLHNEEVVWGLVMYVIVWEGKAISGHETLVRGEDIKSIEIESAEDYQQ